MKEYHVINILEGIYEDYVRDNDKEYTERNLALTEAVKALTEIQQYRAIGTVEECREARERQRAKKVVISHNGCVKDNGKAFCPNCGLDIHGKGMVGHCFRCGQAIDWSDAD